jgi:hypothetical protein
MLTLELEAPRPIDEHGEGTEWGGPRRWWRWSARLWHGPDSGGGGVASRRWRGPDGGGGGAVRGAHGGGAVHGMNPAVVGEVVGDSSTWTRWLSGRWSVRTRRLWRCGGSRGAGGHSEMKKKSSARV